MHRNVALALVLLCCNMALAQKERASMIGIGHADILDTYISQEKASGWELRYVYQWANRKDSSRLTRTVMHQAFVSSADTRGNSHVMLSAMYNLKFGWHHNFCFPAQRLNVRVGGLADAVVGGLYNTRNSNNPAQLRLALSVDPSVAATWRFRVKGKPFALRYAAAMPIAGIAFSPNYGQSYYEIFSQGNYDHNVVFISPFSGPQLHQQLTLDFRLFRTTFTVGYLGDIRQWKVNDLKYHQYTHALVVGWRY